LAEYLVPTKELETDQRPSDSSTRHSVWLTSGFVSRHFVNQEQYTQPNPGLGLVFNQDENWAFTAGRFRNSLGDTSRYAQVQWTPSTLQAKWGKLQIMPGISAGVMDGYKVTRDGKFFPSFLPLVKFEYRRIGVNLIYVPSIAGKVDGALALQASLRFFP
jgi:hypothetical protein